MRGFLIFIFGGTCGTYGREEEWSGFAGETWGRERETTNLVHFPKHSFRCLPHNFRNIFLI